MAVTNFSPLLGLALPTTGDLSGTWGIVVNDSITSLLDSAVAGTTALSADTDVTLSTTNGAANQARNAVLLCTGARTGVKTITAPAQSKAYIVVNATTGGYSVKVVGAGPTTGVTIKNGKKALIAWNGSDFVVVASTDAGDLGATTIGESMLTLPNPSAVTFPQFNTNNTVSALGAAAFRAAIGAGTGGGNVTGPGSSTAGAVPVYADTSGTVLAGGVAPGASGNVLTSNGTQWVSSPGGGGGITAGQSIAYDLIFSI